MSGTPGGSVSSPFKQPKAVFAVAFACVVSFMGIGLVDPILPAISHKLHASPFFIAAAALVAGIVVLSTAHGLLGEAERVQAEQASAVAQPSPEEALVVAEGSET